MQFCKDLRLAPGPAWLEPLWLAGLPEGSVEGYRETLYSSSYPDHDLEDHLAGATGKCRHLLRAYF